MTIGKDEVLNLVNQFPDKLMSKNWSTASTFWRS